MPLLGTLCLRPIFYPNGGREQKEGALAGKQDEGKVSVRSHHERTTTRITIHEKGFLRGLLTRSGHAVGVHDVRVQPLRLEERIMTLPIGESFDLFVYARAVSRAIPLAVHAVVFR